MPDLESNSGSFVYLKPCGVPSDSGVDINSNSGSKYYYLSANDYILYGQNETYPQPTTNIGTTYYFYKCNVPSDPGININSNTGTSYYYSPNFNCVKWCD